MKVMTDIDRAYTVTRISRSDGWVTLDIQTKGCQMHQMICMTVDEEERCYGPLKMGDVINLRFLD